MHELVRCSCTRINDPWRRFCGGCGHVLAPACTDCGFVNAKTDRFCGGCGTRMMMKATTTEPARGTPVRFPSPKPSLTPAKPQAKSPFQAPPKEPQTMPIDILEEV